MRSSLSLLEGSRHRQTKAYEAAALAFIAANTLTFLHCRMVRILIYGEEGCSYPLPPSPGTSQPALHSIPALELPGLVVLCPQCHEKATVKATQTFC